MLVDCAVDTDTVLRELSEKHASLRYIVLTHGHFDHISTLDEMRDITGAKAVIHRNDAELLGDSIKNGYATFYNGELCVRDAELTVGNGDTVDVGDISLSVIHTPGHTRGSVCLLCGDALFTGDTLFAGNIGRCDLYGGDGRSIMRSLRLIAGMEPSLKIYAGHGPMTTLERELSRNYYIRDALKTD